jgi:putative hydroxymethylpyrimidine transport system substrate-binding protein
MIRLFSMCAAATIWAAAAWAAPERVTLMLDWYKNPNHAPILLAQARGDYAKAGLSVEIQEPADPNDPPKLAAAGRVDLAIGYQPQAMMLIDKGVPVARVSALVPTPLNSVMVLAEGPVRTLADLKGRKTGYSVSGFEDALLGAMLASARLKETDVQLINVNFSLAPSLLSGQTDAVIGAFRNYETHQIVLKGKAVRTFPVEAFGVPPYEELVFLAAKPNAKSAKLRRFAEATAAAAASIKADPKAAWAELIAADPKFDNELNRRAFADSAKLFATRVAPVDPVSYAAFARFLTERKLTRTPIPLNDYAP